MKRPDAVSASPSSQSASDEAFAKAYPTLWGYVADCQWDDGKNRETSALSFTWKEGLWQLALNDKALKQSFYTAAGTLQSALKAMEKALLDGSGQWRPWKRGK